MQLPPWEAFAGFAGLLIALGGAKVEGKWQKWIIITGTGLCILGIVAAFFPSSGGQISKREGASAPVFQHQTGSNIINQAVVGASNTVIGQQVINHGVPYAEVELMIRKRQGVENKRLAQAYKEGYVMLGVAEGRKIVCDGTGLKTIKVTADWENATLAITNNRASLVIPNFGLENFKDKTKFEGNQIHAVLGLNPAKRNVVKIWESPWNFEGVEVPALYFELIDLENKIFVIGFR